MRISRYGGEEKEEREYRPSQTRRRRALDSREGEKREAKWPRR